LAVAIQGNHGLFEATGSAVLGIFFPEFSDADLWRSRSISLMKNEIVAQILPDGFHVEGVMGYHIVALQLFGKVARLAQIQGLSAAFPSWYANLLYCPCIHQGLLAFLNLLGVVISFIIIF